MARITINLDDELGVAVRAAAVEEGISVSAWLAGSADRALRQRLLRQLLNEYQAEHGAFTDQELDRARERLRGSPESGGSKKEAS